MEDERIKSITLRLVEDCVEQYGVNPSFKQLIEDCIYLKGITTADYLFQSLKQGWILNDFEKPDFKLIQKELFPFDRNYLYEQLEEYLNDEHNAEFISSNNPLKSEEVSTINNEIMNDLGIVDIDAIIWEQIIIAYENNWNIEAKIIAVNPEHIDLLLYIPNDLSLPTKELESTLKIAKMYPNNYKIGKSSFNENDKSLLLETFINVQVISIDLKQELIIVKPLKK